MRRRLTHLPKPANALALSVTRPQPVRSTSPRWRTRALLALAGLAAVATAVVAGDWLIAIPADRRAEYIGRKSCVDCHQQEHDAWHGSDHDLAMDYATPEFVLGDFNNAELEHFDVTSTFSREGDKFYVTTENARGELEKFHIKYVFGVRPLQQYMVEFPDGRVQVLSIAWDVENERWFHLYPDQDIPAGDWLHWTGKGQNWNYMCAECHSTNLQKNYDLASDTFHTTWSEIDVSCESCHGPGSIHLELANSTSLFWDRNHGYGLARLKGPDSTMQLQTCAPCHARRRIVYPGHQAGSRFLDYYEAELLDDELYYPDGQILEEDYEYGSFLQSRMYREGVRCTDCHDPHSLQLRMPGNQLCAKCHVPAKYDTPAHHHHEVGSKGASCVECHMPERTYMLVDPRRDHSIRIPRPDLTVELGVPNACDDCHEEKGAQWAADQIVAWYGPKRRHDPHFGVTIAAGRAHDPHAVDDLSRMARFNPVQSKEQQVGPMVRASAVALLGQYGGSDARNALEIGLKDEEPMVRAAAVRGYEQRTVEEIRRALTPLLDDPIRGVRTEAARLLSQVPRSEWKADEWTRFEEVLAEWMTAQHSMADQAASHLNLGVVYTNLGQSDKAIDAYRTAIRVEDDFVPARVNLATLLHQHGQSSEAEQLLRKVLEQEPEFADGWYSLGLLLAELQPPRMDAAAEALGKAAELAGNNARMFYNYGLALQRLSRLREAEAALLKAAELEPTTIDFLHALVVLYAQQRRWPQAIEWAEKLAEIEPRAQGLLMNIKQQAEAVSVQGPALP